MSAEVENNRPPARIWARRLGYAALLLLPLIAVEAAVWRSVPALLPTMRKYDAASDTKKMLIKHPPGCPDLIAMGTSLTDRTIVGRYMNNKRLEKVYRVTYAFDFAMGAVRADTMLAQWRWLQNQGCTPRYVVVELTPLIINSGGDSEVHDESLLDLETYLGMPDGLTKIRKYDLATLAELFTYDRLLIKRRRKELMKRASQWIGLEKKPAERPHPVDGQLRGIPNHRLKGKRLKRETRRRERMTRSGVFDPTLGPLQMAAYETLLDEVQASGARLLLHSPPVTPLYRRLFEKAGDKTQWCEVVAKYRSRPKTEWFNQLTSDDYALDQFNDWVHLNQRGARRYARNFRKAVFSGTFPHDTYCD